MGERAGDGAGGPRSYRLVDMHCHLDRMADPVGVARDAGAAGLAVFCTTVEPAGFDRAHGLLGGAGNVRVGAGLHPWWVDDGRAGAREAGLAALRASRSRFVGEVGLDFGRAHAGSRAEQLAAFEGICRACAERPVAGRVFSIHAVHAAGAALDVLERLGLTRSAACVFHWFSGTSEELARARRLGCLFSVNEMMLATRRGREYARQIPVERLLLETDYPKELDGPCAASEIVAALDRTLDHLAEIRGTDRDALAVDIAARSTELLGLS